MADDLPEGYEDYDDLSVSGVKEAVADEDDAGLLDYLHSYEKHHKNRKTALRAIERRLKALDAETEESLSVSALSQSTDKDKDKDSDKSKDKSKQSDKETDSSDESDESDESTNDTSAISGPLDDVADAPLPDTVETVIESGRDFIEHDEETDGPIAHEHREGGKDHIYVRNPHNRGAHIGQWSFKPGEVKDLNATDKVRQLIRQGKLQVVKEA